MEKFLAEVMILSAPAFRGVNIHMSALAGTYIIQYNNIQYIRLYINNVNVVIMKDVKLYSIIYA